MLSFRKRHQRKPTLSDLSYFIEETLVNDHFFPNNGEDEYSKKRAKHAGKCLAMNLTRAKEDQHQRKECQMFQKNHDLDVCFKYLCFKQQEHRTVEEFSQKKESVA